MTGRLEPPLRGECRFGPGRCTRALPHWLAANDVQLNLELNALEAEGRGEVVLNLKLLQRSVASLHSARCPDSLFHGQRWRHQCAVPKCGAVLGCHASNYARRQRDYGAGHRAGFGGRYHQRWPNYIDTRKLNTTVLVGDGETIVLGGVFEETNNNDVEKVPVGGLPLLGKLFRNGSY